MDEQVAEKASPKWSSRRRPPTTTDEAQGWLPNLKACMASWTVDGNDKARPTLTVFWAGPTAVKAVVNDKRTGMQLWGLGTSLPAALEALDALLGAPEVPWEKPLGRKARGDLGSLLERLLAAEKA